MGALEILPDATSIKTRFPEFTATANAVIAFAIEEAARSVDDSWADGDQLTAVSLLTAHMLSVAASSAGTNGRDVVSETIGPISVTYAQMAQATEKSSSNLEATAYGKRFKRLLRSNRGGPRTV